MENVDFLETVICLKIMTKLCYTSAMVGHLQPRIGTREIFYKKSQ